MIAIKVINTFSEIEISSLILGAGILSLAIGLPFLYYNIRHPRLLTSIAGAQLLSLITAQIGLQFVSIIPLEIKLTLLILAGCIGLMSIIGFIIGWLWLDGSRIILGLSAGWGIWSMFTCIIQIEIIITVGGIALAGILSYMTKVYGTPLKIIDAGFISTSLVLNGIYLTGLGITSFMADQLSSNSILDYRKHAAIVYLPATLLVFGLNAGYHYRSYRIRKECFQPLHKLPYKQSSLYNP